MRQTIAILAIAYFAHTATVQAQAQPQTPVQPQASPQKQAPAPEEMQKMMAATFGVMIPVMGKMTESMIEAQLTKAAAPDTAERLATFKRNLFDALLKKGFTTDQAIQIVLTTGIPTAAPSMK